MKTIELKPHLKKLILGGQSVSIWQVFNGNDVQIGDILELKNSEKEDAARLIVATKKRLISDRLIRVLRLQTVESWDRHFSKFIERVGYFRWKNEKIWALDIPVEEMDISQLLWHFDAPLHWYDNEKYSLKPWHTIRNPKRYKEEYNHAMNVDMKYPLDIIESKGRWLILDGLHRLMKAHILKMKTVKVRKIPKERIPEITPFDSD